MNDWTRILSVADCPIGSRRFVAIGDRELAVFHLADPDRFVIVDNACPHAAGNLSAGEIENGAEIVCPWHYWSFNLDSGACTMNDAVKLRRYTCKIENSQLMAMLD